MGLYSWGYIQGMGAYIWDINWVTYLGCIFGGDLYTGDLLTGFYGIANFVLLKLQFEKGFEIDLDMFFQKRVLT